MKKIVTFLMSLIFLSACSSNKSMEVFSFDVRNKDVTLENVVLVSNGDEAYLQPTFQIFRIESLTNGKIEPIKSTVVNIYEEAKNLIYSIGVGENQEGVLDTQTSPIEGELVGSILESNMIKDGKKLYVEFIYDKAGLRLSEEVEVELNKEKR